MVFGTGCPQFTATVSAGGFVLAGRAIWQDIGAELAIQQTLFFVSAFFLAVHLVSVASLPDFTKLWIGQRVK